MLQPDRYWSKFCQALNLDHLIEDPRFRNMEVRRKNCEELIAILDSVFLTKSSSEWLKIFKEMGEIICSPVNTLQDLLKDIQVLENDYLVDFDHPALGRIKVVGIPIKFYKTPARVRLPAPEFGQHTEEILLEKGYGWEEIIQLKDEGVI